MGLRRALVSVTTLGSFLFGGLALAAPPATPTPATAPGTATPAKPLTTVKHEKVTLKPVTKPHLAAHHVIPVKKGDAAPKPMSPKGN